MYKFSILKVHASWEWWHMPESLLLGWGRQEAWEFKAAQMIIA
jgi:hypothetical protein